MKDKIAVLEWALNVIKSKPGIEKLVAKINHVWFLENEPEPLPVGESSLRDMIDYVSNELTLN
ncbi:MAG: hypothetical protein E7I59_01150 [Phytobacter diazotrophicus]|nr:hypothetical protein [Phytobacter diazotrophicus]DAO81331.1 MAG TPA: hypothetical protein [Caudoviricetes sp.]